MASREAAEADTLVQVQLRVAAAAVVARLLGAGVALERGHVAGAQDVLLSEDGRSHQDDLGKSRGAESLMRESCPAAHISLPVSTSACQLAVNQTFFFNYPGRRGH